MAPPPPNAKHKAMSEGRGVPRRVAFANDTFAAQAMPIDRNVRAQLIQQIQDKKSSSQTHLKGGFAAHGMKGMRSLETQVAEKMVLLWCCELISTR